MFPRVPQLAVGLIIMELAVGTWLDVEGIRPWETEETWAPEFVDVAVLYTNSKHYNTFLKINLLKKSIHLLLTAA